MYLSTTVCFKNQLYTVIQWKIPFTKWAKLLESQSPLSPPLKLHFVQGSGEPPFWVLVSPSPPPPLLPPHFENSGYTPCSSVMCNLCWSMIGATSLWQQSQSWMVCSFRVVRNKLFLAGGDCGQLVCVICKRKHSLGFSSCTSVNWFLGERYTLGASHLSSVQQNKTNHILLNYAFIPS